MANACDVLDPTPPGVETAVHPTLVRLPLLVVAAIVMAVALWLLVRVVFNPLDARPGA